ncbi:glycosyltransferase family 2 protein [Lysinibacillus xylanilyticus]|uniref:glycosyltransferase family 2 protein n=1 Tax=Lysinibacillus xylanilyticus TaxID=582475 RepID=UPI0037FC9F56
MEKVSIISPVYNGEEYISRYLESILNQTYPKLELILIDDGSTDNTREVIFKYESLLKKRGIEFYYIHQENMGAAAALNKGFKLFSGDYITWPDTDDYLEPNSIELRIKFLKSKNLRIVRSDALFRNENNVEVVLRNLNSREEMRKSKNIFEDLILEKIPVCNGTFLVESELFLESIPNKTIYESKAGQNWQILLPVCYKEECGYLDIPLYNYIIRENSHSRKEKTKDEIKKKYLNHQDILIKTIEKISFYNESEKIAYINQVKEKYIKKLSKI